MGWLLCTGFGTVNWTLGHLSFRQSLSCPLHRGKIFLRKRRLLSTSFKPRSLLFALCMGREYGTQRLGGSNLGGRAAAAISYPAEAPPSPSVPPALPEFCGCHRPEQCKERTPKTALKPENFVLERPQRSLIPTASPPKDGQLLQQGSVLPSPLQCQRTMTLVRVDI